MENLIEKYGTLGTVAVGELEFPIINIPMMPDETWHRLARENAIHNFTVQNGRVPVNVDEALTWQRSFIAEVLGRMGYEQ